MTSHTVSKSTYDQAKQMAADGHGWEDIVFKLKISRQVAKIIVMGKYRVRKATA